MISIKNKEMILDYSATSLFLICEPLTLKILEKYYSKNKEFPEALNSGWKGYLICNQSPMEYYYSIFFISSLGTSVIKSIPVQRLMAIAFEFEKDAIAYYKIISEIPQRIHAVQCGKQIEPTDQFDLMVKDLNHDFIWINDKKILTFSDTQYVDQIKMLAALSLSD